MYHHRRLYDLSRLPRWLLRLLGLKVIRVPHGKARITPK